MCLLTTFTDCRRDIWWDSWPSEGYALQGYPCQHTTPSRRHRWHRRWWNRISQYLYRCLCAGCRCWCEGCQAREPFCLIPLRLCWRFRGVFDACPLASASVTHPHTLLVFVLHKVSVTCQSIALYRLTYRILGVLGTGVFYVLSKIPQWLSYSSYLFFLPVNYIRVVQMRLDKPDRSVASLKRI